MKKRIIWLDVSKGLCILFVVLGHSITNIEHYMNLGVIHSNYLFYLLDFLVFTFIMPCFFSISGYLYKSIKTIHGYLILFYKKVISLIIPYIFFSLAYIIWHPQLYSLSSILLNPISYLWFLYALFFMFLITGLLDLISRAFYYKLGLGVILFVFSQFLGKDGLYYIGSYIFCFYMGYFIRIFKNKFNLIIGKYKYYIIFLEIFLILIQIKFLGIRYGTDWMTYYDFITKLLSIVIFFIICKGIKNEKFIRYFSKYGKLTLVIYLVHLPISSLLLKLILHYAVLNPILLIVIMTLLTWYISLFICYLSDKISIINFIFYPRNYINKLLLKTRWGRIFLKY